MLTILQTASYRHADRFKTGSKWEYEDILLQKYDRGAFVGQFNRLDVLQKHPNTFSQQDVRLSCLSMS